MPTIFTISGPFDIPFANGKQGSQKRIEKTVAKDFWDDEETQDLAEKKGCYIFSLRAGRGYTPWYVGMATKSFGQECFTVDKREKYNEVLWEGQRCSPVMFFVVFPVQQGRTSVKKIQELEKFLIQSALMKNSKLINISNTRNMPDWGIQGVTNSKCGKPKKCEQDFRMMMGL